MEHEITALHCWKSDADVQQDDVSCKLFVCLHTKRLLVEHVDDYVVNRHWRKRSNTVRTPELLFSIQLRGTSRSKMADAQYGELEKLSMHTCRLRHHEEKREHFYELL